MEGKACFVWNSFGIGHSAKGESMDFP